MYGIAPIFAHPNFRCWLTTDSPAMLPVGLLYPQEQTFLGVSPMVRR